MVAHLENRRDFFQLLFLFFFQKFRAETFRYPTKTVDNRLIDALSVIEPPSVPEGDAEHVGVIRDGYVACRVVNFLVFSLCFKRVQKHIVQESVAKPERNYIRAFRSRLIDKLFFAENYSLSVGKAKTSAVFRGRSDFTHHESEIRKRRRERAYRKA